jgi:hypothetical protein
MKQKTGDKGQHTKDKKQEAGLEGGKKQNKKRCETEER